MMKDWTDIIGEELENIEEPLPADDRNMLLPAGKSGRLRSRGPEASRQLPLPPPSSSCSPVPIYPLPRPRMTYIRLLLT